MRMKVGKMCDLCSPWVDVKTARSLARHTHHRAGGEQGEELILKRGQALGVAWGIKPCKSESKEGSLPFEPDRSTETGTRKKGKKQKSD